MLRQNDTTFVVIDVQEKIADVMHQKDILLDKLQRLIRGMQTLEIPIILTEQYPKGLGHTVNAVKNLLPKMDPLEKRVFSCCDDTDFVSEIQSTGSRNIVVSGIEAHVCVYQTVRQLLDLGYEVEVVADAVDSRNSYDKEIALEKMQSCGARLTTVEMVLFELQGIAEGKQFKAISEIIK